MRNSWVSVSIDLLFYSKMELSMKVNGREELRSDKVKEYKFGQTAPCMKDIGLTTKQMVKED